MSSKVIMSSRIAAFIDLQGTLGGGALDDIRCFLGSYY
jgi:hypothetical protein